MDMPVDHCGFSPRPDVRQSKFGSGRIRTSDTLTGIPVFETGPFNHSGTLPLEGIMPFFSPIFNTKKYLVHIRGIFKIRSYQLFHIHTIHVHADLACFAGMAVKFDRDGKYAKYQCVPEPCECSVSYDRRLGVVGYPCKDE